MVQESVPYDKLFYLGYLYYDLQGNLKGRPVNPSTSSWTCSWTVNQFEDRIDSLNIEDKAIHNFIGEAKKRFEGYKNETDIINETDRKWISDQLTGFWSHFVQDVLFEKKLIPEIENPTLNPTRLRQGISGFFDEDEIKKMDSNIQGDFQDGINCLLIDLATPSVMIILRGVEGVLRKFYKKKTGRKASPPDGTFKNWGTILAELDSSLNDTELKDNLRYLNERRNEAEHPDKRFTSEVAERTLIKAVDAVKEMIE